MRTLGLWGGGAALLLALGAVALAADPPKDTDDPTAKPAGPAPFPRDSWNPALLKLFGQDARKPATKPDKDKDREKKGDAPAPRPSAQAEAAAHYRALEEAKLHRRQDVCRRLREIAYETQDDDLERLALELDEQAFAVYMERTRRLPGQPTDTESLTAPDSDEAKDAGAKSTASVREVKP
jgi:hypothetical protein